MHRYLCLFTIVAPLFGATIDLHDAVVVVRPGVLPNAEKTAVTVLVEEVEKRKFRSAGSSATSSSSQVARVGSGSRGCRRPSPASPSSRRRRLPKW
jgi:hypothetical protein